MPYNIDIDECAIGYDNCNVNADCTNTEGSFNCSCHSSFFGNGIFCDSKNMIYNIIRIS